MKKLFTLFAAVLMAGSMMAGGTIVFTEALSAGSLNGQTFGEGDLVLTVVDTGDKISVDRAPAKFGDEQGYWQSEFRLKSGGKSSAANHMTLTVGEEGTLYIYARTGSNSATDRSLVISQNGTELFSHVMLESEAISVPEEAGNVTVYPINEISVAAGTVDITYPVGSINFYGFSLNEKIGAPAAVDLTFANSGLSTYEYEEEGDWYLSWYDESDIYQLKLLRVTEEANKFGHFTTEDFDLDYCSVINTEDYHVYDLTSLDVTMTEIEGGFTLTGTVVGDNGVTYNLNGKYYVPAGAASVESFSALEDLAGLTISYPNDELTLNSEPQETDGVFLMDAEMNNVFAFATSYSFNDHVLTITGFEELAALPEEAAEMVIYMEGIFDGYYQLTVPVAFAPAAEVPEHLYIIGDFQSWTPAQAVEMTAVEGQEGVFTYDYELATNGYFGFITVQDADWDVVNANRFGAAADGTIATVGAENPNAIVAGTGAFQIPAGHYTFTVDVVNMTFVAEDAATGIHNTTVENVTKMVENGHVVILRDGKKFNLVGAEL